MSPYKDRLATDLDQTIVNSITASVTARSGPITERWGQKPLTAPSKSCLGKPRQVRRDEVKPIRKRRDQFTKHVARAGKSVKQQQYGRIGPAGFPVEHVEPVDIGLAVLNPGHKRLFAVPVFWGWSSISLGMVARYLGSPARVR